MDKQLITNVMKGYIGDVNDSQTWASVVRSLKKCVTATVVCDEVNNDSNVIEENKLIVDLDSTRVTLSIAGVNFDEMVDE